ncbi:MAG TPA: hypothetical protein VL200_09175 [Lacunisphaera sp.]|jgi:hypothetical protein|nr:hypothetical protein [Lacunisphaera sp.]
MRIPPRLRPKRLALLLAAATTLPGVAALAPTEWRHRQPLEVTAPGLVQVALPPASFDAAQPGLADLRILGPDGREIASLLDRELRFDQPAPAPRRLRPRAFTPAPAGDTTQLLIETGTDAPLAAIELETAVPYFFKAAHADISDDGREWQSVDAAVPIFRQFGAEQLRLPLAGRRAAYVRITIDEYRSRPITFSGAGVIPLPGPVAATQPITTPVDAAVSRREEFAGETVLTLTLPGRNLPVAALAFEVTDALFMRRVSVAIREARGGVPGERTLAAGTLYRVALEGSPARAQLELPVDFAPDTRELLVHIHNGDSPPLGIAGVQARLQPVHLRFNATVAGTHQLLSGNPQAEAPRYDLAAFAAEMRRAAAVTIEPGPLTDIPDYHPRETLAGPPLPDVPLTGAPLDASDWSVRRAVRIDKPGVQELELDAAALAGARPNLEDVRLLRDGHQVPYVLEQPALARAIPLAAVSEPDAKRPGVSRWRLALPRAGLPLRRVILTSRTPLFSRTLRLYEKLTTAEGRAIEHTLATGDWSRTPDPGVPESRAFDIGDRPQGDALWLETENGDNAPIALDAVQATYPVARLIFKTDATDGIALVYGNPAALAPHYDLSLVSSRLLTAPRAASALEAAPATAASGRASWLHSNAVFWAALSLVVVVLLVVVAKLLPKPPAA